MKQSLFPRPHHALPPKWVGLTQAGEGLNGTKTAVPRQEGVPGLAEGSAGSICSRCRTLVLQSLCVPVWGDRGRRGRDVGQVGTGATPSPAQPEPWPSLAWRADCAPRAS